LEEIDSGNLLDQPFIECLAQPEVGYCSMICSFVHVPATRRLFLKLSDRFYRSIAFTWTSMIYRSQAWDFPPIELKAQVRFDPLHRDVVGAGVITLGDGHTSVKHLFPSGGRGDTHRFLRGRYFDQVSSASQACGGPHARSAFGPMQAMRLMYRMIRKLLKNCQRGVIERWFAITERDEEKQPAFQI